MKKFWIFCILLTFISSGMVHGQKIEIPYKSADFEGITDGKNTYLITIENKNGLLVNLTNYGAKIVSLYVPDRNGIFEDVVLGFRTLDEYKKYSGSHGAVVGPYANRISNARFVIGNDTFHLPVNNNKASLHSGPSSWYRKVWDFRLGRNNVVFNLESPDGEFGFPGNKKVRVTYTLTDKNELKIEYRLTTDKPCHFNLTNHSYFNLRGEGNGDVTGHFVVINANKVTVVDEFMIPTGEIADIRGTDLDFTKPYTIGSRLNSEFPILKNAGGYDFNYVINRKKSGMVFAASAYEPESGRFMETFTTEPGIQFFSANHMKGLEIGKRGNSYQKHAGFCFETQHYPDSPNQPSFPTTLLKPGQELKSSTVYRFSVK